jgi:NADH-quinone oxidoreductase subunit L
MGKFMILRFSPMFKISTLVLYVALIVGATTILYGAVFSVQTGDLKKAVAYSTISQIGYLYCGCGLLALRETLVYLVVHAVSKAMLFIFVGYIVHLFGGTTSFEENGGYFLYCTGRSNLCFHISAYSFRSAVHYRFYR